MRSILRSRPLLSGAVLLLLTACLFAPGAEAQDASSRDASGGTSSESTPDGGEEVRSALQQWRETLLYGINSEIAELLPTLTDNREADLLPEVAELFNGSSDPEVLTEAARYLTAMEADEGHDRARQIIQEDQLRGDDLLVALMDYLRETDADLDDETVAALTRIATDGTVAPARAAVRLMGAGGVPTDELISLYRDTYVSDDVRGLILIELGDRGDPEVFDFVSEIIQGDEEAQTTLQRYAIDTLGKLGDPRGLPTILRQLGSSDALTRAYAVNALTNFDTDEANQAIQDALRDEFWRVRVAALQTIADRKMTDALPAVMYKVRRDPEQRVRLEAITTLAALDQPDGWSLLEERVQSTRTGLEERGAIVDVLINEHLGDSLDVILALIDAEWETENSRLLDVIGRVASQVEDRRIEPVAERLLNHPNFLIQIYGIRAVGRSRLASLIPLVEDRQGEGNHRALRQAAMRTLEQLGPR